jgi:hypothetical protein
MSTKSFEQRIAEATSSTEIAEICKQEGERVGVLVRNRDGSIEVRDSFAVQQSPAQKPEDDGTLLRRAVTLPGGTIRVIEGYSHSGLDILEAALRQQQR